MSWMCPVCNEELNIVDNQWRCVNGHSFDRAKEGYVNLLLAQQKKSKQPGDNKEMVLARRQFLSEDHYQPLALAIAEQIAMGFSSNMPFRLHDLGCGEGYYLRVIEQQLMKQAINGVLSGNDISKVAIQKAAKQCQTIDWSVASSFQLPLSDGSVDAVLQVFAPVSAKENARVVKSGGWWFQVEPAADHLMELKQALYRSPEEHKVAVQQSSEFTLVEQQELKFSLRLEQQEQRLALLKMTPYYWRVPEDGLSRVIEAMSEVTAHFYIRSYQRTAN